MGWPCGISPAFPLFEQKAGLWTSQNLYSRAPIRAPTKYHAARLVILGNPTGHRIRNGETETQSTTVGQPLEIIGLDVDYQTRCEHSASALDVLALRFKCCEAYYACVECHDALAGHEVKVWGKLDHDAKILLCGACRTEFTIRTLLRCNDRCPNCNTAVNPEYRARISHVLSPPKR